ncbi:MAG: TIGR03790 family protein [Rubrivivax sp.]|nr:TIGR03790 family protein [Rubrivivax sp.]
MLAVVGVVVTDGALAQASAPAPSMAAPVAPAASVPAPRWVAVPRVGGRLRAADIGLVINTADPYSVAVGEHYIAARRLARRQVLRLELPVRAVLTREEFERLRDAIDRHFGAATQALALAWAAPYAVECNSITGALALGFDSALCRQTCGATMASRYFNSASARPYADHGMRPAMLLAAADADQARALIDRGVAADGSLAGRDHAPVAALFLETNDSARRVRRVLYPPPGPLQPFGVEARTVSAAELNRTPRVLLAVTGSVRVDLDPAPDWVPGALADHLTSVGGALQGTHGQSTVLDWIASGATASHGAVSEPCNHLQKFPHPQLLLLHYLQGATAIEAYWKSVLWPQQSLFVGEPLAAPFARR